MLPAKLAYRLFTQLHCESGDEAKFGEEAPVAGVEKGRRENKGRRGHAFEAMHCSLVSFCCASCITAISIMRGGASTELRISFAQLLVP